MKITQLMLAKGFGGGERLFIDLIGSLSEMGHDVLAICQAGYDAERMLKNNHNIRLKTVRAFSTRDPFVWRAIASKIEAHDSDIVQSHMSRGAHLAGKACKSLNKPLVVTLHNYIDLKYYKNVTNFIPATVDQVNYLRQKGVPEKKIKLIPHFSHLDPATEPSFRNNDVLMYGSYGRLVKKKGFHVLLNAFEKLRKSTNAELVIGGDGPEREDIRSLVVKLGLQEKVKFIGWVKDVGSFLNNIDVFVLPSLDEPFGIAVLEAMAMGKPIISTKSQGPKEILNNGNSYLAEVNDIDSLSNEMIVAAKDKAGRERRAVQALIDYKNFYSKQIVVPKFLQLYEQTMLDWKANY